MSVVHLEFLLKDFQVNVVRDNASCHRVSQQNKNPPVRAHRRRYSDPGEAILPAAKSAKHKRTKQECRWQSAPLKKSSDMDLPPVLKRRVDGPIVSIANLPLTYSPIRKRDKPPTCKRSTEEEALSLEEVLDQIDELAVDNFTDDFMEEQLCLTHCPCSTHTIF